LNTLRSILKPIASLRLTVILLAMSMLLIFAGTLAQRTAGIQTVKKQYFHTWVSWIEFQNLLPFVDAKIPGAFPMPGGWTLIVALLVNLLTAHTLRFKFRWQDAFLFPMFIGSVALLWVWQGVHTNLLLAAAVALGLGFLAGSFLVHQKRAGVIVLHLGLIVLLTGEFATSKLQVESQMNISEGTYANYSQDIHEAELAVIDRSPSEHDNVVVVPESQLRRKKAVVSDPKLPFDVHVEAWYLNSRRAPLAELPAATPKATEGHGLTVGALNVRPVSGVGEEASMVNMPSAYVTLRRGGQTLGTYLVSLLIDPQEITVDGKTYTLDLRFRRYYKPFLIHLKDFSFDRYVGTEVAKNYSSVVRLVDPTNGTDRELKIWMNHPLRYNGETYYQQSFTQDERTTVLQVVRNPSWLMPYYSCAIVALGMLIHFLIILAGFLQRQLGGPVPGTVGARGAAPSPPLPGGQRNTNTGKGRKDRKGRQDSPANGGGREYTLQPQPLLMRPAVLFPATMAFLTLALVALSAKTPSALRKDRSGFDYDGFARLPINYEGRPMPMESLARDTLKVVAESERLYVYDAPYSKTSAERRRKEERPQVQLLLDFMSGAQRREDYEIFRIKNQELLGFLDLDEKQKRYTLKQILTRGEELNSQIQQAAARKKAKQPLSLYDKALLELAQNVTRLRQMEPLMAPALSQPVYGARVYVVPPLEADEEWRTVMETARDAMTPAQAMDAPGSDPFLEALKASNSPAALSYVAAIRAYSEGDKATFNREVAEYARYLDDREPRGTETLGLETFYRRFDPFHLCMYLYVLAFVVASLSWLGWRVPLRRGAMAVLLVTFAVHTLALLGRFVITGRPPVTTLYTSAIFIGWVAIVASVFLEFVTRRGIGTAVAAAIGFVTQLLAHYLYMAEGDSMAQLQAVLDTNLWLWVHVQTVTIGYAATFLAAALGIVYIVAGLLFRSFNADSRKIVSKMLYGVVCFAMLFSFFGTTAGGIWADQSWGRFWGWDPKENGAILIVAWNAIILHARWAGIIRERGLAVLAVLGAIVTIWSYFGTNMMGVGLHSYGFTEGALIGLLSSWGTFAVLAGIGLVPLRHWRSYADDHLLAGKAGSGFPVVQKAGAR
jgi:ABC-type transport system involved in cytochrome c biogenesis permease subunit